MRHRELLVLTLLFVLTLPLVTSRLYASDEVQFFSWLRSLVFDRDASFENEYQHFAASGAGGTGFHETFLERATPIGRRINFGTIGPALLWSPFYVVGHLAALATGAPKDGYSRPYVIAVAWGSAVYGLLALLLSISIARQLTGRGLAAGVAVWLGTPLLFYTHVAPVFSHACSAFAVSLFLWTWLRVRERWSPGGALALGLAGGLMGIVREQDVFFVAGPALDFARWALTRRRVAGGGGVAAVTLAAFSGALAFALAYSPQVFASLAVNGHIGPHESVANKMTWTAPHAMQVLFSTSNGLFAWTPLAAIAIGGLVWMAFRPAASRGFSPGVARNDDRRWIAACLLVTLALQIYINGSVESWSQAGGFGQRRFVALTPLLVIGLAAIGGPRLLKGLVVALCIWWNLGLIAQFGMHRMDRQRLTLGDNAWATFVQLPREAPGLAWRYLTDRASFYGRPRQ